MKRQWIVIILSAVLATHISGCGSSESQSEDAEVATTNDESFAEEGKDDFSDESNAEGEEQSVAESTEGEEESLEDASGATEADELALDDTAEELPDDIASNETSEKATEAAPPVTDEAMFNETAPPADTAAVTPVEEPQPVEEPVAETSVAAAPEAAPTNFAPLQKMKTTPFQQKGTLLNRVYLARSGDSFASVGQKIYGSDRAADLKSWNPSLAHRDLKVGDKVYYSSPQNPTDSAQMMTYYEDMGVPASTYSTKEGDNIRAVAKDLLGSKDSWKELWATNLEVESKGDVPAGLNLRYWPEGAATTLAQNAPPPETAPSGEPPPPPAPTSTAATDPLLGMPPTEPPPPSPSEMPPSAMGSIDASSPPPPPPADLAPPPPPVSPKKMAAPEPAADQDTTMLLGVAGILLVGAALILVVMRKNRAKRVDLGQTQV